MSRASRRHPDPDAPPTTKQRDDVQQLLRQLGRDPNEKVGPSRRDAAARIRDLKAELRASSRAETVARYEGLRYSERKARDSALAAVDHTGHLRPAVVLAMGHALNAILDRVQRQRRTIVLLDGAIMSAIEAYEAEYGAEEVWRTQPGMASPSDEHRASIDVLRDAVRRVEDDLKGETS